jgi:hypothetical protein
MSHIKMLLARCRWYVVRGWVVAVALVLVAFGLFTGAIRSGANGSLVPGVAQTRTGVQRSPATNGSFERTIATQKGINRYFDAEVFPKLRTCWNRLQGEGMITFDFTYTKDARGRWVWEKLGVRKSTLGKGQDGVALACMQDSVRGTSFPAATFDTAQNKLFLHWNWPVPLPADASEQVRAMLRSQGGLGTEGGCDGHGAPPACLACGEGGPSGACISVCVGAETCTIVAKKGYFCVVGIPCASGGPFGLVGHGTVLY